MGLFWDPWLGPGGDHDLRAEIAATAARLIAEEGCEYAQAKRRAVHEIIGDGRTSAIPDNAEIERELRRYLQLYEAQTHPKLLAGLRVLAGAMMDRLPDFEPHLTGAVLKGTATQHSDIHLLLYVDSAKDVEVFLMNAGVEFDVSDSPPDERPRMLERLMFVMPAPRDIGLPRQVGQVGFHLFAESLVEPAPLFVASFLLQIGNEGEFHDDGVKALYAYLLQKRYDERLNLLYFAFRIFDEDTRLPREIIEQTALPYEDGVPSFGHFGQPGFTLDPTEDCAHTSSSSV